MAEARRDLARKATVEDKPPKPPAPLTLESAALFQGLREVRIRHRDEVYRLSITRLDKLILTK